jgi:hypothetical protein
MELGLNLLWLSLAVVALAIWRRQSSRLLRRQRLLGSHGLIAIGCTLAFLFPVISITDDLHAEQAIIEDSNPAKRALRGWGAHHASPNPGKLSHPAVPGAPSQLYRQACLILGYLSLLRANFVRPVSLTRLAARAPPSIPS